MSVNEIPDYELEDLLVITAPEQLRALADPLRSQLLELLLERAATITEMAAAVDRPKSSVAYHVNLLDDVGLIQVVRTRRVRAIEERYYGRLARTYYVGALTSDDDKRLVAPINGLAQAAVEAGPAHVADELRCTLRPCPYPYRIRAGVLDRSAGTDPTLRPDSTVRRSGLWLRRRPLPNRCPDAARHRRRLSPSYGGKR